MPSTTAPKGLQLLRIDKHENIQIFAFYLLWLTLSISVLVISTYAPRLYHSELLDPSYCQNWIKFNVEVQNPQFLLGSYNCLACHNFESAKLKTPFRIFQLRMIAYLKVPSRQIDLHDYQAHYSELQHLQEKDAKDCMIYANLSQPGNFPFLSEVNNQLQQVNATVLSNNLAKKVKFACTKESAYCVCNSSYLHSGNAQKLQSLAILTRLDLQDSLQEVQQLRIELASYNLQFFEYQIKLSYPFIACSFIMLLVTLKRLISTRGTHKLMYSQIWILTVLLPTLFFYNDPLSIFKASSDTSNNNDNDNNNNEQKSFGFFEQANVVNQQVMSALMLHFWLNINELSKKPNTVFSAFGQPTQYLKFSLALFYAVPSALQALLLQQYYVLEQFFEQEQQQYYEKLQNLRVGALLVYSLVYCFLLQSHFRQVDNVQSVPGSRESIQQQRLAIKQQQGAVSNELDSDSDEDLDEDELAQLAVNGNNNTLITLSTLTFILFTIFTIKTEEIAQNISVFSSQSTRILFNFYVYLVAYFYLPVSKKRYHNNNNDDNELGGGSSNKKKSSQQKNNRKNKQEEVENNDGESFAFDKKEKASKIELQDLGARNTHTGALNAEGYYQDQEVASDEDIDDEGDGDGGRIGSQNAVIPRQPVQSVQEQADGGAQEDQNDDDDGDQNNDFNEDLMADISDEENQQKHAQALESALQQSEEYQDQEDEEDS